MYLVESYLYALTTEAPGCSGLMPLTLCFRALVPSKRSDLLDKRTNRCCGFVG